MMPKLYELFDSKKAFTLLFLVNVFASLSVFVYAVSYKFPDASAYWVLGESILHGKFSTWYFFSHYYPETLRTPGYPVFLALCRLISGSSLFVKVIQLLIYFICVLVCTRIIRKITPHYFYRSLFLLLLLFNIQIVFYSGVIGSEMLNIFFVILAMYMVMCQKTFRNALMLAVFSYCAFIIRPAFLLFPFLLFLYFIFQSRKNIGYSLIFISAYLIFLIPFGIWNKNRHGIFKVTCLEGGAGVAHIGFWLFKLPDGYSDEFYWPIAVGNDAVQPTFCSDNEKRENAKLYEKECKEIFTTLEKYNSKQDSAYIALMKTHRLGHLPVYNSRYTIEREKALWTATTQHILSEPFYYLKTRLYILGRCFVTGIDYTDWEKAKSLSGKLKVVLPFIITFMFIFLGLIFITVRILFYKVEFQNKYAFLLLFWYYGLVHLPFTIQGRYTVPVHLLILMILSISLMKNNKAALTSAL